MSHHVETFSDPSNYLDCGSVSIFVQEYQDLIRFAGSQERGAFAPAYVREFALNEFGRVQNTTLCVGTDENGVANLDAFIGHRQPIDKLEFFSTRFLTAFMRQLGITDNQFEGVTAYPSETTYRVHGGRHPYSIQLLKGYPTTGLNGSALHGNKVHLSLELDDVQDHDSVIKFIRAWGNSLDVLARHPMQFPSRKPPSALHIDIGRLNTDLGTTSVMQILESYRETAAAIGETVPGVSYESLDLPAIAEEIAEPDGHERLDRALALAALDGRKLYGRTGIMPPLTTGLIIDAIRRERSNVMSARPDA